jgi:hypothetical protein
MMNVNKVILEKEGSWLLLLEEVLLAGLGSIMIKIKKKA